MSIKVTFVFGLLLASGWTQEPIVEAENVSDPVKEASVKGKSEVISGNEKTDEKNFNKDVDEKVEKTENGVKASAKASASFYFNFEEFIAKLFEALEQNKDENSDEEENNKKDEIIEEGENNVENNPAEETRSPCNFCFNVHARSSASASARSTFFLNYNFSNPKRDEENNEVENTEGPRESVEENRENISNQADQNRVEEDEKTSDAELIKVPEHCNQQNGEGKEPSVDKPLNDEPLVDESLNDEDKTQVKEVEQ